MGMRSLLPVVLPFFAGGKAVPVMLIPAQANGKPVAGQFNLPIDYRMMTDPEQVLTGSHLRPRERWK